VTIQDRSVIPDDSKVVLDSNLILKMYNSAFANTAMGIPDVVESPSPPLLLSDEYIKVSTVTLFFCLLLTYTVSLVLLSCSIALKMVL
jgi:hypothetical protein